MKQLRALDRDLTLAVAGLALIGIGLALVYIPAAFVVVGAALLLYALLPDVTP